MFAAGAQPGHSAPEARTAPADRKSTRLNSSHSQISYAVFCLKKKKSSRPPSPPRHVTGVWRETRIPVSAAASSWYHLSRTEGGILSDSYVLLACAQCARADSAWANQAIADRSSFQ